MTQPSLLDNPCPRFDSGVELTTADHVRLGAQIKRVLAVLREGGFWSVPQIHQRIWQRYGVHDPEPSISAQVRNAKKVKHGGHQIERIREANTYKFRLVSHG